MLRDEIIAWHKKTQEDTSSPLSAAGQPENMDSQQLVSLVQKAVTAIMTRLHNLAQFEGGESKVNTLVAAANSLDNLCRMDPAWHPWLWLDTFSSLGEENSFFLNFILFFLLIIFLVFISSCCLWCEPYFVLRKCERSFPDDGLPVPLHFVSFHSSCVYSSMAFFLVLISWGDISSRLSSFRK